MYRFTLSYRRAKSSERGRILPHLLDGNAVLVAQKGGLVNLGGVHPVYWTGRPFWKLRKGALEILGEFQES